MSESVINPFVVTLNDQTINIQSGHNQSDKTIRDRHFTSADTLISHLYSDPFDTKIQKKLGLWLYRELPIQPERSLADSLVFTITDREVWGHIPWELVYDGSSFMLDHTGARYQVFTQTKLNDIGARPLGYIDQLKVALISTDFITVEKREEIISWLGESAGFYHLQGKQPQEVRDELRGIQPDVVLMDALSSSLLMSNLTQEITENHQVQKGGPDSEVSNSGIPNDWEETSPDWVQATTDYLFAGMAPPLIIAPFNENFAFDALLENADQVVLGSRYQIDDEDYYDFARELLQTLSPEKPLYLSFTEAVSTWQDRHSGELRIPLLYSRFPYVETGSRLPYTDKETKDGLENPVDPVDPDDRIESDIHAKDETSHNIDTPVHRPSPLPAPDLQTATVLSSYRSDVAANMDQLGVQSDVANLCQVIMAKKWKPPLSIGLFGAWGSGKTSFINLMQHMIKATADRAHGTEDSAFVSSIIQIEFNAWHYLDANLWANLMVRLLDGIHSAVFNPEPGEKEGDEFKQIVAHLHVLQKEIEKSEARQRQLESTIDDIDSTLELQRQEQETTSGIIETLRIALFDSDNAIAKEAEDVRQKIREAAKELGFDAEENLTQAQAQTQQLRQTGNRINKAYRDMTKNRLWWFVLPLCAVLILVGSGLDWVKLFSQPGVDILLSSVTSLIALFISWNKTLSPHLKSINMGLDALDSATSKVEGLRDGWLHAKQKQLADLESLGSNAVTEINALEARQSDTQAEQKQLLNRLEQLRQGQGLEEYLLKRAGSADYQEQLGIIALIHLDMKELQRKLRAGLRVTVKGKTEVRKYDRVVLYIDDLDRCTPARVVEVLQAVHLLLSIPLFVVVVAADPRWLLQCLLTHYQDLLHEGHDIDDTEWAVTPQNYLEKIFQIPYTLPPMASRDFPNYVADLFSKEKESHDTDKTEEHYRELVNEVEFLEIKTSSMQQQASMQSPVKTTIEAPIKDKNIVTSKPPSMAKTKQAEINPLEKKQQELTKKRNELRQVEIELKTKQQKTLSQLTTFETNPNALNVPEDEQQFVTALLPLLTTPRTTKRLLNVYRLIRVSLGKADIRTFESEEHQAVFILLAVMYSYPAIATEFFNGLKDTSEKTIRNYAQQKSLQSSNGDWKRLSQGMNQVTSVQDINVYLRWIDIVGRFSFPGRTRSGA